MIFSLPFFNFNHMHFCEYIAVNNPNEVQALCDNYQMPCETEAEAAQSLVEIASLDKRTLKEVLDIHPDKDVIIELFTTGKSEHFHNATGCGCDKCRKVNKMQHWIRQADGQTSTMGDFFPSTLFKEMQTNTLLIIGIAGVSLMALIVATRK